MKTESVAEFLNRGGKITKAKYQPPDSILTAIPTGKPEPSCYEMDCDPNVVQVPVKPDLVLGNAVDSDIGYGWSQPQEATETSDDRNSTHLPRGRQDRKS